MNRQGNHYKTFHNGCKDKEIPIVKSPGNTEEYHFFEQVEGPDGSVGYAEFDDADNEVRFTETFMDLEETKQYEPLDRVLWPLPAMAEPRIPADYPAEAIYDEVREYIYTHLDLPDDRLYDVLSAWVLSTWTLEKWESVPYVFFLGPRDSGKTRGLETLHQLSYRGILSPSASPSSIFRHIEKYHPAFFLDEAQIYGQEEKREAVALLNAGYRRGQYVLRTSTETNEEQCFDVFGFKALASTSLLVLTLESRAIVINMDRNIREVRLFLDREEAKQLRMKLLLYRFQTLKSLQQSVISVVSVVSPGVSLPPQLSFGNGRIIELFYPLVSVANRNREVIISYAKDLHQSRLEEEKTTIEAQIVQALVECEQFVEQGRVSTEKVAEKFNEGRSEKERWKTRSVGKWLKKLGFKRARMPSGNVRGQRWDPVLVERLRRRYLPIDTPGKTTETTETTVKERLALGNLLPKLKDEWKRGTNEEFEDLIMRLAGYTTEEASRLREKLLEDGSMFYDRDGYLVWV